MNPISPRPIHPLTSLIPPHGGYRQLKSYQMAEIAHDLTIIFCQRYVDKINLSTRSYKCYSRQSDQMIQAARSGKQNIAEGSQASGTSKKTELKLIGVARASLEELLQDYHDFLRQHQFPLWSKDSATSGKVRKLAYRPDKSYKTYLEFLKTPESAANTLICLIHQTNYLLDQLLKTLETDFLNHGGFTERLYQFRRYRQSQT